MIFELLNINLVKELGLDQMSKEKKDGLVAQMSEVVENRINLEVLSILTDDEKKDLDKVLDTKADLVEFLKNKIPNFELMVAEIVANFKKEILDMQPALASK